MLSVPGGGCWTRDEHVRGRIREQTTDLIMDEECGVKRAKEQERTAVASVIRESAGNPGDFCV